MKMYRYRNAEQMLNFKEIENKNMFFAPSNMQNDPMEGISDVVWNGDYIAWENLFRNYCMNLCQAIVSYDIAEICEESKIYDYMKIIKAGFNTQEPYFYVSTQAAKQFVTNKYVMVVLDYLIDRDVRKYELIAIMKCIYPLAIQSILMNLYADETQYPIAIDKILKLHEYDKLINYLSRENINSIQAENYFQKLHSVIQGMIIAEMYNKGNYERDKKFEAQLLLLNDYTDYYINEITKWCFPNYYMTCFSKNCENSSMWSYYADAHKGVCLIYDIPDEDKALNVIKPPAFGIPYGEKNQMKFYDISYQKKLVKIEFFKNCLKIMQLKDVLKNYWILNEKGDKSKSFGKMIDDKEGWLKEYESLVINVSTRKDKDWRYEEETRLIMLDYWKDEICSKGAAMEYDFSKLVGIIFGINMLENVKIKIIQALNRVGKLNDNFEFYQAFYDDKNGNISKIKIPITEVIKNGKS